MIVDDTEDKGSEQEKEVIGKQGNEFPFHKGETVVDQRCFTAGQSGKGLCKEKAGSDEEKFHADIPPCKNGLGIRCGFVEMVNDDNDSKDEF